MVTEPDGADLIWVCNPNNPTGELRDPTEIAALARAHPQAAVVVDEAYWEFAGVTCVPLVAELPNLIVLRTLSKAFGFAALRVGYAVAAPETAAELERRRPPASVSAPAARIAAAALREPRLDVEATVAERERVRDVPRRRRLRLSGDARQLRLAALGGAARRAPRGGRARRPDLRRRNPDLAAATARERRPARGARRDRRPVAGPNGARHAHEQRDRAHASCSTSTASAARASRPGSASSITC